MDTPTPTQINEWSQVEFGELGYPDDPSMQVLIDRAAAWIEWVTGQTYANMPTQFETIAAQAVQYMVEDQAYQSQPENLETVGDFMLISSFSAGSYSETRRSLEELKKFGWLSADPRLNSLLWAMLTPEKRDDWTAWIQGINAPAFETTEVDWRNPLLDVRDDSSRLYGLHAPVDYGIWSN
jgi:hypothetical protein